MDSENTENDKPRRLEEDTTNYLRQIETQFTDKLDNEEKAILVENVLSEIKTRTASATCDRNTNFLMEKICYAANLPNLLEITKRCSTYGVFLARNRYSSHVLQAIIARLCYILKFEDFGDVEECDVQETIVEFVKPILKEISWLGREMSASHVLRSLFSLMAGMPVIAERKGKNSKHQHSISLSEPLDTLIETGRFYINKSVCFSVPPVFHDILVEATNSLLTVTAREIQVMIADSSCCAVLGLLVRILANPELLSGERGPELAQRLFRLALEWDEDDASAASSETASNVFYAMAGDRSGSYFLESLIECCEVSFLLPLLTCTLVGKAREYADDSAANFVIQAVLRRLSAEQERHVALLANGKKLSQQQKTDNEALNAISDQLLEELTATDYFASLVAQRGGVLLWLLELAQFKTDESWAATIGNGLIDAWISTDVAVTEEGEEETPSGLSREQQLSAVLNRRFQPVVLTAEAIAEKAKLAKSGGVKGGAPTKGPDVDSAQLLCARLVGYLLKSRNSAVSSTAGTALSKLSSETLKYIAMSGPLSRAVMDVFFAHFSTRGEFKALGASLTVYAVELADHYVGQHIVRRSFECCDLRGKEKWAMVLSAGRDKLMTRKEGRSSLQIVNAELYSRDPAEWRSLLKKQAKAATLLSEMEGTSSSGAGGNNNSNKSNGKAEEKTHKKDKSSTNNSTNDSVEKAGKDNTTVEEGEEGENVGKAGGRKRKRKRAAGGKANGDEEE